MTPARHVFEIKPWYVHTSVISPVILNLQGSISEIQVINTYVLIRDVLVLIGLILLPYQGHSLWVIFYMTVQAVLYMKECIHSLDL